MSIPSILAALTLIFAVPLNWYVTFRLFRLSDASPELRVLRERALVAVFVAIVVTVFALIFVNNDLVPPVVPFDDTKILTRAAMLAVGVVPASYWLWLYR